MLANELMIGDIISFEDAAYAYRGVVVGVYAYNKENINAWKVVLDNGNVFYFLADQNLDLYKMELHMKNCPFCGAGEEKLILSNYVRCLNCKAKGPVAREYINALRKWNNSI